MDQIELKWEFQSSVDPDRAGVLIVRRKGAAPDLSKVEDGRFYIGPEITLEVGEARRKFIRGYLGFATTTTLKSNISIGSQLSSALDSTIVSITHADFANYPQPPSGGVCYMHLGATTNSPAEIVAYSSVNASGVTTIQRGQLGTSAVSHPSSVPVSFYPPRPVAITEKMGEESPISGFPVTIKVNVSVGGLRGFPSVGVIRVGSEYMSYDSITFGSTQDTMNISQRGLNSSTISPHSSGAKIRWAYHPTYTSDTIVVESTSGFPNSGRLKIGDEEMWYNYKTPTTFHGIVRGIHTDDANKTDTIVSAHSIGVEVMDSLYKVVMNDQDLDGPSDSNNDGNNDMIATSWVDDIYFGDDPTSYFYYVFTYDDVYNYSQGKFASVNDLRLEQYKEPGGANASTNAQVIFTLSNLAQKIEVSGGDVFYFRVQGGTPKFNWAASESGLSTETAPPGFNNGGEPDRYVYYKVPDRFDVLNKDIIISVTDNSETAQTLSIILNVTFVNEIDPNAFYVTSDKGIPPLKATTDATITINPGDTVTFKMNLPPTSNIANATWFLDPASTFVGVGNITDPLTLVYTATSQTTPGLKDGMDIIIASDGVTTIRITVIIADSVVDRDCVQSEILTVTPGTDGEISVSPGSKVTFTATGGTCNFTWDITANNSVGASLTTSTRGTRAIYTAGTENRTVDIIELSDGVNTKVIKVKIASGTNRSSSGGCFIRSKSRD